MFVATARKLTVARFAWTSPRSRCDVLDQLAYSLWFDAKIPLASAPGGNASSVHVAREKNEESVSARWRYTKAEIKRVLLYLCGDPGACESRFKSVSTIKQIIWSNESVGAHPNLSFAFE